MNYGPKVTEFIEAAAESLQGDAFVKLTMGNYHGSNPTLKSIIVRKIQIREGVKLSFTYRHKTNDTVKNFDTATGLALIEAALNEGFRVATLFTTVFDLIIEQQHSGFRLRKTQPAHKQVPSASHDHNKKRLIDPSESSYLSDLGITDAAGKVLPSGQDKYRQINRYIEILRQQLTELTANETLRVVDMGSGKGYLTFALYDYLVNTLHLDAEVTGVEYRPELVDLCNGIARKSGFGKLHFMQGSIEQYNQSGFDVLIALHACDTATDDAIYKGITAGAKLIVVAPCCHKQIRRQIESSRQSNDLDFVTRHGIFLERQAEMITDSLRALILEYFGYKIKVFEFISDAHTPKNVMITGLKQPHLPARKARIIEKVKAGKAFFGIEYHHLEKLLNL